MNLTVWLDCLSCHTGGAQQSSWTEWTQTMVLAKLTQNSKECSTHLLISETKAQVQALKCGEREAWTMSSTTSPQGSPADIILVSQESMETKDQPLILLWSFSFQEGSHSVAQVGLEIHSIAQSDLELTATLLPQPPRMLGFQAGVSTSSLHPVFPLPVSGDVLAPSGDMCSRHPKGHVSYRSHPSLLS